MRLMVVAAAALAAGLLVAWRHGGREEARRHGAVARHAALPAAALWFAASALGWSARERLRRGSGHASPTAAWIGKRGALAALVAVAIYALSPVGWSAGLAYGVFALGALSWGVYVANLPLKL